MSSPVAVAEAPRWSKTIQPASFSLANIVAGLRTLVHYRDLLYTLTVHRIKVRYKQSVLGLGWAILQPLLLMAVYTIVFSVIVKMPSDGMPYAVFVYAALLPWTFFSSSITSGATSMVTHTNLITKVYFPREILPITYILAALFDFVMASVVLAILLAVYHVIIGPGIWLVIPLMAIASAFSLAIALILSAFQVRFRDIGIALALIMQLWMYATPVVYPLSVVPRRFLPLYLLNPMAGVIENFRQIVLKHASLDFAILIPGLVVCAVLLPVAYLYFKSAEATMADVI